jgi:uncharacterized protein (DUF427 family)
VLIFDELKWEPSERWVRATRGGTTVVDSKHPVLVREPGLPYPTYAFREGEVRTDLLRPAQSPPADGPHAGSTVFYDLHLDGAVVSNAAWRYPAQDLAGYIAFEWFRHPETVLEHWYEEQEEIFVLPRDPYHRVDALRSSRHVRVEIDGRTVAESYRPVAVFETGLPVRYYLPPEDVDLLSFEATETRTHCPYKGEASHWSYRGEDGPARPDVVWSYQDPLPAVPQIEGYLAFYEQYAAVVVDGVKAGG